MFQYTVAKKLSETVRGQKLLVYNYIALHPNSTVKEIVSGLTGSVTTCQDLSRVVGYYSIVMSKSGHLTKTVRNVTENDTVILCQRCQCIISEQSETDNDCQSDSE